MGERNVKNGSEPEPKEVEHGGKVIADQILILIDFKGGRNYDEAQSEFRPSRGPKDLNVKSASCRRLKLNKILKLVTGLQEMRKRPYRPSLASVASEK